MALRAALGRLAPSGRLQPPVRAGWLSGRHPQSLGPGRFRQRYDYFLYVPGVTSWRNRVPLLVMLHGCNQDAHSFANGTRMNSLAEEQRFIVLYPQQSKHANPLRCWNWFQRRTAEGAGETAAIAALVRYVVRRYPIDRSRVYLAGMSAGGAMTAILALCDGAMFAACGIVSGMMYRAADSALGAVQAMRAGSRESPESTAAEAASRVSRRLGFVPTLVMHGDADTVVHHRNAELTVAQFLKFAALMGMQPRPLHRFSQQVVVGNGRSYRQSDYAGSREQVMVRSILIDGLGHAWSGGDEREMFNDPLPPDASRLLWDFLSQFRRPAEPRWRPVRVWFRQWWRYLRG
jgi:poly(hydroxyalkanoate) depolymerase family esterase